MLQSWTKYIGTIPNYTPLRTPSPLYNVVYCLRLSATMLFTVCDCPQHCIGGGGGMFYDRTSTVPNILSMIVERKDELKGITSRNLNFRSSIVFNTYVLIIYTKHNKELSRMET